MPPQAPDSFVDVHAGQPVREAGAPLERAAAAMILVHGRGAGAHDILGLADVLARPDLAYRAPEAAHRTWYPYSFLAPLDRNEPGLSSGLATVGRLVDELGEAGFGPERIVLLGFSQGACLALEYAARHPRRYGGVVGLSGGLIGPPGAPRDYPGSLDGTPVFLGCSDIDAHIPLERVKETTDVLGRMGASVEERIYPGMAHTIVDDEIRAVRTLLHGLIDGREDDENY